MRQWFEIELHAHIDRLILPEGAEVTNGRIRAAMQVEGLVRNTVAEYGHLTWCMIGTCSFISPDHLGTDVGQSSTVVRAICCPYVVSAIGKPSC